MKLSISNGKTKHGETIKREGTWTKALEQSVISKIPSVVLNFRPTNGARLRMLAEGIGQKIGFPRSV